MTKTEYDRVRYVAMRDGLAWPPAVILFCKWCDAEFARKASGQVHCSPECQRNRERDTRKVTGGPGKGWSAGVEYAPRRTCRICGERFYAPPIQIKRGGGKFCSMACYGKEIGMRPARWPHTHRAKGGRREDLGSMYFRSSWEANYARYLNWLVAHGEILRWEYESETFEFPVKRGSRFYTPDFLVIENDGSRHFIEVKGWMDQRSKTKLKRMARHFPKVRLDVVGKREYSELTKKISGMVGGWEL